MFDLLFNRKKAAAGKVSVVFDVGGTNMRVAVARDGKLENVHIEQTLKDPKEGIAQLVRLIRVVAGEDNIKAVVGCVAGMVSSEGVISDARNLPGWDGTNIVSVIKNAFGTPVFVFNDGELVGLGEATKGAGVGSSILAYVTVSTGVGGARIVNGQIDHKASTFSIGRVPAGDSDLEGMISGTAIKKRFGIEAKELVSIEERTKLAELLAGGLFEVSKQWHPDTIVLGGAMITGQNPIPFDVVEIKFKELVLGTFLKAPAIKKAALGDLGGLYGGLAYLEQQLSK